MLWYQWIPLHCPMILFAWSLYIEYRHWRCWGACEILVSLAKADFADKIQCLILLLCGKLWEAYALLLTKFWHFMHFFLLEGWKHMIMAIWWLLLQRGLSLVKKIILPKKQQHHRHQCLLTELRKSIIFLLARRNPLKKSVKVDPDQS